MTKHFIRQRPFSTPYSAKRRPAPSFGAAALPLAFLDSVSSFETLRAYRGKIFHLDEHCRRLAESCRAIHPCPCPTTGRRAPALWREPLPIPLNGIKKWLNLNLKESGWRNALLRLGVHGSGSGEGRLVLIIREFRSHPRRLYEKGINLKTVVSRRWTPKAQDPQIKASQFVNGVLAYLDCDDAGAGLVPAQGARRGAPLHLFLGSGGTVAEGSVSNIFVVRGKRLLTPSAASGILRGVTRGLVLDLARKKRLEVTETFLTRHDIYSAAECFITNTSSEILPVVNVDNRRIGNGRPGPVTRMLAREFKSVIASEAKRSLFLPLLRGGGRRRRPEGLEPRAP